ncbi:phosphodiester glycosidase family protein [Kitasatospora sp. NPDC004240]
MTPFFSRLFVVAPLLGAHLLTGAAVPLAVAAPRVGAVETIAPGVEYRMFELGTPHGPARVHRLTVDLRHPGVRAGLLHTGTVTERATVSSMATDQGAVAAVNGDFFHLGEDQHPGVQATGAPSGAAVLDGRPLKGAVPQGQRFGGALPAGGSGEEVLGVGVDGVARTGRLRLRGTVHTPQGPLPLGGLDQYALPEGSIGLFDPRWGAASRARAACGTDRQRSAPCTGETHELTVRRGVVVSADAAPGSGPIPADTLVLLGREEGARALRSLPVGSPVRVTYRLDSDTEVPFAFALGAYHLLRDHQPLPGQDDRATEPRTAVGLSDGGRLLHLLATDGRGGDSTGLTVAELAELLRAWGCEEGLHLDGGGSTTLATRDPVTGRIAVRNHLDQATERRVPNGLAIFVN